MKEIVDGARIWTQVRHGRFTPGKLEPGIESMVGNRQDRMNLIPNVRGV
jgi:hypothetical protein